MKKIFLSAALITCAFQVMAQKVNEADVPPAVKQQFKTLYADVTTASWEKEKSNYEANFKKDQAEISVTIDATGKLLETETAISSAKLPQAATEYLNKNVSGKKIHEASQIKDASGKITFEAEVDGIDYTFDEKGNFLKKEKDND